MLWRIPRADDPARLTLERREERTRPPPLRASFRAGRAPPCRAGVPDRPARATGGGRVTPAQALKNRARPSFRPPFALFRLRRPRRRKSAVFLEAACFFAAGPVRGRFPEEWASAGGTFRSQKVRPGRPRVVRRMSLLERVVVAPGGAARSASPPPMSSTGHARGGRSGSPVREHSDCRR